MPYARTWRGAYPPILTGQGAYYNSVMADAPSRYWRLNELPGNTIALDYSGNQKHGTYSGGVLLGTPGGFPRDLTQSVQFNGTTGNIAIDWPQFTTAFTMELWLNRNTPWVNGSAIVPLHDHAGVSFIAVSNQSIGGIARASFLLVNANQVILVGPALNTNYWHHLVATFDTTVLKFYVDGGLVNGLVVASDTVGLASAGSAAIGNGGASGYAGLVQDVALYPVALSAARILAHYSAGGPYLEPPIVTRVGSGAPSGRRRRYVLVLSGTEPTPTLVPRIKQARPWFQFRRRSKYSAPVTYSTWVFSETSITVSSGLNTVDMVGSNTKWTGTTTFTITPTNVVLGSPTVTVIDATHATLSFTITSSSGSVARINVNDGQFANDLTVVISSISFWINRNKATQARWLYKLVRRKEIAPTWFQAVAATSPVLNASLMRGKSRMHPWLQGAHRTKRRYFVPPEQPVINFTRRGGSRFTAFRRLPARHTTIVPPIPQIQIPPAVRRYSSRTWIHTQLHFQKSWRGRTWVQPNIESFTANPSFINWVGGNFVIQLTGVGTNWTDSTAWFVGEVGVSLASGQFNVISPSTATWTFSLGPGYPGLLVISDGITSTTIVVGQLAFNDWTRHRALQRYWWQRPTVRHIERSWFQAAGAPTPNIVFFAGQRRTRPPYFKRGKFVMPPWGQAASNTNQPIFVRPSGQRRIHRLWTRRGKFVMPPWGQAASNTNQPLFVTPKGQRVQWSNRIWQKRSKLWLPVPEQPLFVRPSSQRRTKPPYVKQQRIWTPIPAQQTLPVNPDLIYRSGQRRTQPPYIKRGKLILPPWGQAPTSNNQPAFIFPSGQRRRQPPYVRRGRLWLPVETIRPTPIVTRKRVIWPRSLVRRGRLSFPIITPAPQANPLFTEWIRHRASSRWSRPMPRSHMWQTAFGLTVGAEAIPGLYLASEELFATYIASEEPAGG